jgi:hypothetical protein
MPIEILNDKSPGIAQIPAELIKAAGVEHFTLRYMNLLILF